MKKILVIIVLAVALIFGGRYFSSTYNDLAQANQVVELSYAQLQNVLARQAELLPNMAAVAKSYATHEEKTFQEVAAARSGLTAVAQMKPSELANNPDAQKQLIAAQTAVSNAMINMRQVTEAYPQLQANDNFKILMAELEGSINRVTVERKRNQEAVMVYNKKVVNFPTNLVAKVFSLGEKPFFKATAEQQHAPDLNKVLN